MLKEKLFKSWILLISVLVITALLFGCSRNAPPGEEDDNIDMIPEIKEIEIWGWSQEFANVFMEDNPDMIIACTDENYTWTTSSEGWGGIAKMASAIQSGTAPDAARISNTMTGFYYANIINPIDPYLEKDPSYNKDDLHPAVFDANMINGKLYAINGTNDPAILIYNKDMFEEVGLDPEQPPKTWSEILKMNPLFIKRDSRGVVSQAGYLLADWFHIKASLYEGTPYIAQNGYEMNIHHPGMVKSFEFIRQCFDQVGGWTGLDEDLRRCDSLGGNQQCFNKGKVAMTMAVWRFWLGSIDNYGIAMFPNPDDAIGEHVWMYQDSFCVLPKNSNNTDGGYYFTKWYLMFGFISVSEYNEYNKAPATYFPQFITHRYSRERCYDMYLDEVDDEILKSISVRDGLMDKVDTYGYSIANSHAVNNVLLGNGMRALYKNTAPLDENLKEQQRLSDLSSENWQAEKELVGWQFPEDNPFGIPPEFDLDFGEID
jgi:ABC-type glycerol-3-phosphate transport system substrate-binding protein